MHLNKYKKIISLLVVVVLCAFCLIALAFSDTKNKNRSAKFISAKVVSTKFVSEKISSANKHLSVPNKLFKNIPKMSLSVVRVIDSDFPDISDDDLHAMLQTAKVMFKDKFAAENISFKDLGKLSIEEFFVNNLDKNSEVYKRKDERRFKIGVENDFEASKLQIMNFIKQWKLEELQSFFKERERANYGTYEDIYNGIVLQMKEKIAFIGGMQVNGKPLLHGKKAEFRSFLNWLVVLELQTKYDLVLTNAFILYDDMSQPSPHSIFHTCKVGGVSHKNELRTVLGGRVIMGSTFSLDTDIEFFKETGGTSISRKQRNDIIGAYIIAHELGHAIFMLPDQYNHGKECLMNNSKETNYVEGYKQLIENPGACHLCNKWLLARSLFWDAETLFEQKKWEEAIKIYGKAIKLTPRNVDGYRRKYMAYMSYKLSHAYYELGNMAMAMRGAKMSVKLYRWDQKYIDWQDELAEETKTQKNETPKK